MAFKRSRVRFPPAPPQGRFIRSHKIPILLILISFWPFPVPFSFIAFLDIPDQLVAHTGAHLVLPKAIPPKCH